MVRLTGAVLVPSGGVGSDVQADGAGFTELHRAGRRRFLFCGADVS
ncbi:hypothetical protein D187_001654 [Cystobacter fuscus DSM 2262]|uniref:Uncharacterized protein n=1 Tax=Cystobacter fuscus (strain ATCC 25194 / DSM 2262 / NBRC 100088 / M29) TaxID=1242864 RepID=S9PF54_CYSF2|nr:hypothetical protein D187_001654 [Cystobacter fuscus DSM 2262]